MSAKNYKYSTLSLAGLAPYSLRILRIKKSRFPAIVSCFFSLRRKIISKLDIVIFNWDIFYNILRKKVLTSAF